MTSDSINSFGTCSSTEPNQYVAAEKAGSLHNNLVLISRSESRDFAPAGVDEVMFGDILHTKKQKSSGWKLVHRPGERVADTFHLQAKGFYV